MVPSNPPKTTPIKGSSKAKVQVSPHPQKEAVNGVDVLAYSDTREGADETVEVCVSYLEHPGQFYLHKMSDLERLKKLQTEVNRHCKLNARPLSDELLREGE